MNSNGTPTPEPSDLADMYGATSAEEAATQSNPNQTTKVVSDLIKSNVPRITLAEGDNWVRFINPYKSPWYIAVGFYKMHFGDKVARVIHQELFGQPNLFRIVQIYLYQNPETKPYMWTMDNPEGFRFDEQRRALLVAAKFENNLGPFGIAQVTLGRPPRKGKPYRPSWGDALINLPSEKTIDPMNPKANGSLRWGSIFDPVDGRLIKCSLSNAGTIGVTATFTPVDRPMPLGRFEDRSGGKKFVPRPEYAEQLRNAPNLRESLVRHTIDQQIDLIKTFLPSELWPHAEKAIANALNGNGRRTRPISTAAPQPAQGANGAANGPATAAAGSTTPGHNGTPTAATVTRLPVPAAEPTEISAGDQVYVAFVQKLGPKFKDVGEEVVRKLIARSLVSPATINAVAEFTPDVLKTLALAA
ncbi:MAG TPA: hypothetical protein PKI20_00390 [Verrucomicrobiota bacterium]|nr:hypothetical protein [Verrucomicrobiota bacterium]